MEYDFEETGIYSFTRWTPIENGRSFTKRILRKPVEPEENCKKLLVI